MSATLPAGGVHSNAIRVPTTPICEAARSASRASPRPTEGVSLSLAGAARVDHVQAFDRGEERSEMPSTLGCFRQGFGRSDGEHSRMADHRNLCGNTCDERRWSPMVLYAHGNRL